jgi:hypothetical protein
MSNQLRLRRGATIAITTATALAAAGVVSVATGAIPSGDGTIHACYGNGDGSLRVVDEGKTCPRNFNPISWSEQGPQGPQGPQGQQGEPGPQGQDVGDAEIYRRFNTETTTSNRVILTVSCDPGDVALSGGYQHAPRDVIVWADQPSPPSTGSDWLVGFERVGGDTETVTFTAFARCLDTNQ